MEQNKLALLDNLSANGDAFEKFGMTLGKSGVFGFTRAEQGVTMLAICTTERMTPLQFMRTFHVMPDGKFTKKAQAALVEFEQLGGSGVPVVLIGNRRIQGFNQDALEAALKTVTQ